MASLVGAAYSEIHGDIKQQQFCRSAQALRIYRTFCGRYGCEPAFARLSDTFQYAAWSPPRARYVGHGAPARRTQTVQASETTTGEQLQIAALTTSRRTYREASIDEPRGGRSSIAGWPADVVTKTSPDRIGTWQTRLVCRLNPLPSNGAMIGIH